MTDVFLSSNSSSPLSTDKIFIQSVTGSRRLSNFVLAVLITLGGIGFSLTSLSSWYGRAIIPFFHVSQIGWIPQGAVMGLYGVLAMLLALYLWIIIILNLGSGTNHFDKASGVLTITRRGLFRLIKLEIPILDIKAVKLEIREGLNPLRRLALRIQGRRNIPLSSVGEPMPLSSLESSGAKLAKFLNVPLEGL